MTLAQPYRLLGEVESLRPLRAINGQFNFLGWCLLAGHSVPPPVRVVVDATIFDQFQPISRPDLAESLLGEPAAAESGFQIDGQMPAGVYCARFEARLPDGCWQAFKHLSLAVEAPAFQAIVEWPKTTGSLKERVHLEGWALDPPGPLKDLVLRYGHQEIACELGRPRLDLPASHPWAPHAACAGFKSKTILSAGRGPLRLKATRADGSTALVRTALDVDIATDENHDGQIDFGATRIVVPVAPTRLDEPPLRTDRPLNVLFVLPGSFSSNSALHVAALANELSRSGHACTVAAGGDRETLSHLAQPAFRGVLHAEAEAGVAFANGRGPDIIHAWTTREPVRALTESLRSRHGGKVVVHLEDNEAEILSLSLGRTTSELEQLPPAELDHLVPPDLSHPHRARAFLAAAAAVTVIIETLREFTPTGKPSHTIWPAADARHFFPRPRPDAFRRLLDRTPGETFLFYHGNVHAANAAEVRELYAAVLLLNQAGEPVTLLRTGLDRVDFLGALAPAVAPHVLSLGQIRHHHQPPLMALADVFVQPGAPDAFNNYRFPSKLPEFFSLGRPVILPRTNLGLLLRPGIDAVVLDRADAAGIAQAVTALRHDPALYQRLSLGATEFAREHFSWRWSAAALANFYRTLADS